MSQYRIRFRPLVVLDIDARDPVEAAHKAREALLEGLKGTVVESAGFSPEDTWQAIDADGHFVWADNDFRIREQPAICGETPVDMPWSMRCCLEPNHSTSHRSGGMEWSKEYR